MTDPARPAPADAADERRYPGERLGLPPAGPGAIGGLGRRILGLCLDWAVAMGGSALLAGGDSLATMGIWLAHTILGLVVLGATLGHLAAGLHLRRVNGEAAGLWRPVVRQLALALIIPALVWDTDHRGGHDILAGTVLRRR